MLETNHGKIIYVDGKPCPVVSAQPDGQGAVWVTHIWNHELSEGYYDEHITPSLGTPARYGTTRHTEESYAALPERDWYVLACRTVRVAG